MNFFLYLLNNLKKLGLIIFLISAIVTGGWVLYLYDISKKPQPIEKQSIVEAENALNIGHYTDAERIFEEELQANPQNQQAVLGLKIAQIRQTLPSPDFKVAIDALYQQYPTNAYINLFLAEFYSINNQSDKALLFYEEAITQNPKLAEAHNDLALFYEQQEDFEKAKIESLKAIDLSPIAKYRNNLGAIYFKQQHYEEAIKEYGRNKEFPLSDLESSKIYWRLEYLSQASSYQNQAIEWLNDKVVMSKPENQEPWQFKIIADTNLTLNSLEEKKNYAYYCLSISLFLQGDRVGADDALKNISTLSTVQHAGIVALLNAELEALVQSNNSFDHNVAEYKHVYLQNSIHSNQEDIQ
jgi:tetratricopeptide (TPR) repeat protein